MQVLGLLSSWACAGQTQGESMGVEDYSTIKPLFRAHSALARLMRGAEPASRAEGLNKD